MTDEQLAEIEARAAAATAGPWREASNADTHGGTGHVYAERGGVVWDCPYALTSWVNAEGEDDGYAREEDLAFIRAARVDVPALTAEVRRLRAALAEAESHEFGSSGHCARCGKSRADRTADPCT